MEIKRYETFRSEETFALGRSLGEEAKAGGIYCLDGAASPVTAETSGAYPAGS